MGPVLSHSQSLEQKTFMRHNPSAPSKRLNAALKPPRRLLSRSLSPILIFYFISAATHSTFFVVLMSREKNAYTRRSPPSAHPLICLIKWINFERSRNEAWFSMFRRWKRRRSRERDCRVRQPASRQTRANCITFGWTKIDVFHRSC